MEIFIILIGLIIFYTIKYFITTIKFKTLSIFAYIALFIIFSLLLNIFFPNFWDLKSQFWYVKPLFLCIIPTITYIFDLFSNIFYKLLAFSIRSIVEIFFITPLYCYLIWIFIFNLGWVSI